MDVEAMNAVLDCLFGSDQGAAMPATLRMELWRGDPRLATSVQIDYPGYAPETISTSTDWTTAASGGEKARDTAVTFGDPTDEADNVATHWGLFNPATDALYFVGELGADGLDISGAGDGPKIRPRVRAADALTLIA